MPFGELSSPLREAFPSPARPARPVQQFSLGNFAQTTIGMSPNSTLNDMKTSSARALMVQLLAFVLLALGNPAKLGAVTVTLTPPAITSGWAGSTFTGLFDVTGQDYYKYSYTVTATVGGVGSSGASASVSMWWGNSYTITTDVAGRGDVIVTVTVDGTPLPDAGPLANDTASASATVTIAGIDSISPATEYALLGTTITYTATINPPGTSVPLPSWTTTGGGTITPLTPSMGLSATFVADGSIIGIGTLTISAIGGTAQTATIQEIDITSVTVPAETTEGTFDPTFSVAPSPEPTGLTYQWRWAPTSNDVGNNPSVGFLDSTAKSTPLGQRAHWYATPDDEVTAPNSCVYMIQCEVSYKGGTGYTPAKDWTVKVTTGGPDGTDYAATLPPFTSGFPTILPYFDPLTLTFRFNVSDQNDWASTVPDVVYWILHPGSEFDAKIVAHENTHVAQFQTLLNDIMNLAYTDKVIPLVGDTAGDVTAAINDIVNNVVYPTFNSLFDRKRGVFEKEAYNISNPMFPVYLNNYSYND